MNMKYLTATVSAFIVLLSLNPCSLKTETPVLDTVSAEIEKMDSLSLRIDSSHKKLIIYYPQTTHFDLVCGEMPDTKNNNLCFV